MRTRPPQTGRPPGVGVAVLSLCLVQFVDVLGVTVVVTSLPAMLASLHAPPSYAGLIATGYAMCFGGLLMLGARLGDRFGHRRLGHRRRGALAWLGSGIIDTTAQLGTAIGTAVLLLLASATTGLPAAGRPNRPSRGPRRPPSRPPVPCTSSSWASVGPADHQAAWPARRRPSR